MSFLAIMLIGEQNSFQKCLMFALIGFIQIKT